MSENKFKGWCAAHDVKVKDIAELLGIHANNASEKINGKQNFTLPQIKVICEKYGISADIFLP
jgi:antitoxin component HigA of HigAB toxin-antitoxin module